MTNTTMMCMAMAMAMATATTWLAPVVAWAHGGHGELGVTHALWHVAPALAVAAVAVLAVRLARRRQRQLSPRALPKRDARGRT